MENYSLSDLAVATGNGGGFGGNWGGALGGGLVGYILGASANGGGLLGTGRGNAATTEDLASGFNFSALQGKTNDILAAVNGVNQNIGNAVCSSTYELGNKVDGCCCQTQLGIQGVKFDMANYAAAANANTVAVGQKILDKLCDMESARKDEIIAQQGQRISALEADARMCGVPRINMDAWGIRAYANCNPCANGNYAY